MMSMELKRALLIQMTTTNSMEQACAVVPIIFMFCCPAAGFPLVKGHMQFGSLLRPCWQLSL